VKVSSTRTIISQSGENMTVGNGVRHTGYDRWRMSWNGNLFAPPPSGSVLYYPGYPGTGSTITDFSGSGNNGTIANAIWRRLPSGLWYLEFDGTDDYVDTNPIVPDFDEESIVSIEIWAQVLTGCGENTYIIALPESSSTNGVDLRWGGNTIYWDLFTHADSSSTDVTSAISLNTWYHLALTYDGTTLIGYKDGASIGSHDVTVGTGIKHALKRLSIGSLSSTNYESKSRSTIVRIYDSPLSATTVATHYQQERHLFGV